MLRSMKDLQNYAIGATDGKVGHVKDFLFDDFAWVIRYFVVETGTWLSSRKVLISPIALHEPNWTEKILPISISKEQVKNSPDIDTDKPVSRQHESDYLGYYGFPFYWGGTDLWGNGMYPYALYPGYPGYGVESEQLREENRIVAQGRLKQHLNDDPHLRSCQEVVSYHIHASDGDIGHVSGLLVDEKTWAIRYLIVDTSNWWLGHKVLIAPEWIDAVSWSTQTVTIDLSRQAVQDAPLFNTSEQFNREHEVKLYRHYDRSGYWSVHNGGRPIDTAGDNIAFSVERPPAELEAEANREHAGDDALREPRQSGWTTRNL